MDIIRLETVGSTNTFLKDLSNIKKLDDFTVVVAKNQVSGRGQMQSVWFTESGKNLTFSVYIIFDNLEYVKQKYLNYAVALSVYEVLQGLNIPKVAIKWPNDILVGSKKIAGILVENVLQKNKIRSSVIGIGLNVNQLVFNEGLAKATSLQQILKKDFCLDTLLEVILKKLKVNLKVLANKNYTVLEERYLKVLYKLEKPSMFKNGAGKLFMGKIIGVSEVGKLQLELLDETISEFAIKEISFA